MDRHRADWRVSIAHSSRDPRQRLVAAPTGQPGAPRRGRRPRKLDDRSAARAIKPTASAATYLPRPRWAPPPTPRRASQARPATRGAARYRRRPSIQCRGPAVRSGARRWRRRRAPPPRATCLRRAGRHCHRRTGRSARAARSRPRRARRRTRCRARPPRRRATTSRVCAGGTHSDASNVDSIRTAAAKTPVRPPWRQRCHRRPLSLGVWPTWTGRPGTSGWYACCPLAAAGGVGAEGSRSHPAPQRHHRRER